MAIFLTGSTGYIGAHVAANLLEEHGGSLNLLVRARDPHEAQVRLWQALQLHLDFPVSTNTCRRASDLLRRSHRASTSAWAKTITTG